MLYILLGGVGEIKTIVVRFIQKDDLLRSKLFTKFSSPTLTTLSIGRISGDPRLP
jgi:hypothetical protein